MNSNLLPCPFCGSTNLRYEFAGSQGYICCDDCGTQGPCDERAADPICDMDAAYLAWNRRAALAQPEPKWPTLAEIDDLCAEHTFHYEDDESLECLLLIITDALARWGSPGMQSLADGEVAELVNHARSSNTQAVALAVALEQLADAADEYGPAGGADGKALSEAVKRARKTLNRAADLLESLSPPQPVPVSERLPGPEDCTTQGWCWVLYRGYSTWTLESPFGQDGQPTGWSHWLPAHALPLPGEVEG